MGSSPNSSIFRDINHHELSNMGHEAQEQIERILSRTQSLHNLSADDIIELRQAFSCHRQLPSLITEYRNWRDKVVRWW
jgi:hypothetical protein